MGSKGLIKIAAMAAVILLLEACGGEERKIEPPVQQAPKPAVQLKANASIQWGFSICLCSTTSRFRSTRPQ